MNLPLPDFNKEIKKGDISFVYKGVYHPIYWCGDDPYRPRVETLVIKNGKQVFLRKYEPDPDHQYCYRLPGGSLDNDSDKLTQAENETNEEALLRVSNIQYSNYQYFEQYKDGFLLKNGDICIAYKGTVSDVYIAEYKGKQDKSKIDSHDLDDDMANNGKFYYITNVCNIMRPEHVDAILDSPLVADTVKRGVRLLLNKTDDKDIYSELITNKVVTESSNTKVPVFLVCTAYKSMLGNAIRKVKGGIFNHAAIALTPDLKDMYTYSRRSDLSEGRILGGFAKESLDNFNHGSSKDIIMSVNVCYVSKDEYDLLQDRMNYLLANYKKTHYNFSNLFLSAFNIPLDEDKITDTNSVCSVFVASVMRSIGHPVSEIPSNLVTPDIIANCDKMPGFINIFRGNVVKYNTRIALNKLANVQESILIEGKVPNTRKHHYNDIMFIELNDDETPYGMNDLVRVSSDKIWLSTDVHIGDPEGEWVPKMNKIINNINLKVKSTDYLLFLGDMVGYGPDVSLDMLKEFINKLRCKNVYLILGNNDYFTMGEYREIGFKGVSDKLCLNDIVLTHCPLPDLDGYRLNVHGHIHGCATYWNMPADGHIDVWDDNYNPIRLCDVVNKYDDGLYDAREKIFNDTDDESLYDLAESITNIQILTETASKIDPTFKKKDGGNFKFINFSGHNVDKYLFQDSYFKKYKDFHINDTVGEIVIDVDNDKLAGYVFVYNKKHKYAGLITPLVVTKAYRGYGLSNKLLDDAIHKYGAVDLVVAKNNEVAIELYKKHGFVIIGYGNKGKSEYWMKLKTKLDKDDKIMVMESESNYLYNIPVCEVSAFDSNEKVGVRMSLSTLTRRTITKELIRPLVTEFKSFEYIQVDDTTKGYMYFDKEENPVAYVNVVYGDDGTNKVQQLHVLPKYDKTDLDVQLVDVAIHDLKANKVTVSAKDENLHKMYLRKGFKDVKETPFSYVMQKGNITNESVVYNDDSHKFSKCFTSYHIDVKFTDNGCWDEELYSKTLEDEILNELSSLALHNKTGSVSRYVYTMGRDYKSICLGEITIRWYSKFDRKNMKYDYEWDETFDVDLDNTDTDKTPVNESNRANLPDNMFGVPSERKYPLDTEKRVKSAIKLFNHVESKYEKELAENIIKKIGDYNIDKSSIKPGKNNKFSKYWK